MVCAQKNQDYEGHVNKPEKFQNLSNRNLLKV